MKTSRKVGTVGYWIPFRNPFSTDRELANLCKLTNIPRWKEQGDMPHWVEYLLEFADRPKSEVKGISGAVAEINRYLEQHPDVEALVSNSKRTIGLIKRIA